MLNFLVFWLEINKDLTGWTECLEQGLDKVNQILVNSRDQLEAIFVGVGQAYL